MNISSICRNYGWAIRKHTKKSYSWTKRKPSVVDLNKKEKDILERKGEDSLNTFLLSKSCFPFPALDIKTPAFRLGKLVLCQDNLPKTKIIYPENKKLKAFSTIMEF